MNFACQGSHIPLYLLTNSLEPSNVILPVDPSNKTIWFLDSVARVFLNGYAVGRSPYLRFLIGFIPSHLKLDQRVQPT